MEREGNYNWGPTLERNQSPAIVLQKELTYACKPDFTADLIIVMLMMTDVMMAIEMIIREQGCISCGVLVSRIRARGVSSEHMENMKMFSFSPT